MKLQNHGALESLLIFLVQLFPSSLTQSFHFLCSQEKTTFQIFSLFSDTSFDGEKAWLEKQCQSIDVVNICINICSFAILQILVSLVCYPSRASLRQGCTAELSIFKENQHFFTSAGTL